MTTDAGVPTELATWLAGFVAAEGRPEMVEAWVDRTAGAVLRELPEVAGDAGLAATLRDAVREHWLAFLAALALPRTDFTLVDAGVRLATEVAEHQLPLETTIKIYRVAQAESWEYVTGVVAGVAAAELDHAALLIYFWTRAAVWIDASIDASIEIHHRERDRIMAGTAAQRYEVVRAVLDGADEEPRRLSAALGGYPVSAVHTAIVLATRDAGTVAALETHAGDLARRLGGAQRLVVQPGGRQLWVWVATRDVPDLSGLGSAADALRSAGVSAGVGQPGAGIPGFVSSHEEAREAQGLAARSGAGLTTYADAELVLLLGCSDRVDRFMVRTLGPLAADDEGTQRLRETLEAFLATGGNVEEAAGRLTVHRNTVRYRVGQVEELLGRPVAKFAAELAMALRHHAAYHG